ncbi:MAG: hypothetical protein WAN50_02725 [Minisyncoccia bacterium]
MLRMENLDKKLFALCLCTVAFAVVPLLVFAQSGAATPTSRMQVIGSVGVFDASVTQNTGSLEVKFTISNGQGSQGDIRYAVALYSLNASGQHAKVDEYVAPDAVSLSPGQSTQKTVTYQPSPSLLGTYQVWVEVQNSSGMPFSAVNAGTITLSASPSGQDNSVEFPPQACVLLVDSDPAKGTFSMEQGVDILPSESLEAECTLRTHYSASVDLTPSFTTYARTQFGSEVGTQTGKTVTVNPTGDATFLFSIPIQSKPQAYDVDISLVDASGKTVSNTVTAHYVLRGISGTIQNAVLDANRYSPGDTAKATVSWYGSADSFPGSRYGSASSTQNFTVQLALDNGSGGDSCGSVVSQHVPQNGRTALIGIPVHSSCDNPSLKVTLEDEKGNILDQKTFGTVTPLFVFIAVSGPFDGGCRHPHFRRSIDSPIGVY